MDRCPFCTGRETLIQALKEQLARLERLNETCPVGRLESITVLRGELK